MGLTKQNRNTGLFFGFFLLAGAANLLSRSGIPSLDGLLAFFNYLAYIGLLLFWIEAVRVRLLPSAAKTGIMSAAFLMLTYMLLRIFKYRFAMTAGVTRYAVYAYWIPQVLIPTLFLMTGIRVWRGGEERKGKERLLLIPAGILALLALTNDLHFLVYRPRIGLSEFVVESGTYSHGFTFYLLYAWMILTMTGGLVLLFREAGKRPKNFVWMLSAAVGLWFGLLFLDTQVFERHFTVRLYNAPEIHIFGMLAVFETCIRCRLIPYNENYAGFFRKLQIPAVITDRDFRAVYRSESGAPDDPELLREAMKESVPLTPDVKLHGREIRAGYAFWAEDESAVRRMQEELLDANEMIGQEIDLIRAETEQKEKDAYLQSRHRIYHEIAGKLYPCQRKIAEMLDGAAPGTDGFRETIAAVSVLNAYVKRKTNLLLLAAENDTLSVRELFLALQESAGYLTLAGLRTTAREPEEKSLPSGEAVSLYDAFEAIAEQLVGKAPSLMVSWNGDGLRLAAETDCTPDTGMTGLPVRLRRSEGVLFADIPAGKGGEA